MKFQALKDAIDKVIPKFKAEQPKREIPSIPFYSPGEKKQTVAGGDLLRAPIDKTSAMVVRPAPWWAKPPPSILTEFNLQEPKPSKSKNRKERRKGMSQSVKINNPALPHGAIGQIPKPTEVPNSEVAADAVKKATSTIESCDELARRAMDARAALEIMSESWKVSWMDFIEQSDERLLTLRQTRMAFDTETKVLMASLREVRQFFLDKTHEQEVVKLKEFIDLCERLKKLKESGFLDTVADTILKLA